MPININLDEALRAVHSVRREHPGHDTILYRVDLALRELAIGKLASLSTWADEQMCEQERWTEEVFVKINPGAGKGQG